VLPEDLTAEIDLASFTLPPVFAWLKREGRIDDKEMLKTFSCGIGMVVVTGAANADAVDASLRKSAEKPWRLGSLVPRQGNHPVFYAGGLSA
jgi:phosphoribosylformylglycinamidine cyclo-ligase